MAKVGSVRGAVAEKVGDYVGGVVKLGNWAFSEILDLDPTVDEWEVRTALQNAITNWSDDPASTADAVSVVITGLWTIKAGT